MWKVNDGLLVATLSPDNLDYLVAGGTTIEGTLITRGAVDVNSGLDYSLKEAYSRFMRVSALNIQDAITHRFCMHGIKDLVGYFLIEYLRTYPPYFMNNGYTTFMLRTRVDAFAFCSDIMRRQERTRAFRGHIYEDIVSNVDVLAFWGRIEARTEDMKLSWELDGEDIIYAEE